MIKNTGLLNKIKSIPSDDTLYLLEKISNVGGLFAYNGNVIYLALNQEYGSSINIQTEFLHLETNVFVSSFNQNSTTFENGFYNLVELRLSQNIEAEENLNAFVNLCFSHAIYMDGNDFVSFFDSLVAIFQLPREQNYKNLIGLYGELTVIKFLFENYNVDFSKYWHNSGSYSKIDFVTPYLNIEVKSTTSDQLLFSIKHEQLFEDTKNTFLCAVSLIENNSGLSLNELVEDMLNSPDYCNVLDFAINLEAEKRRISPKEAEQKRFVLKNIYLYNASEICPFYDIPESVYDLTYKLNLSLYKKVDIQTVIVKLKNRKLL